MKTVGFKKQGVGLMYGIISIVGIGILIGGCIGGGDDMLPLIILGALFTILGGVLTVQYLMLPYEIIKLDSFGRIYLPRGVVLNPDDIIDVSYEPARAKHVTYKWGSITITTRLDKYKYGFVRECEDTAKAIVDAVHRAKYSNEEFV